MRCESRRLRAHVATTSSTIVKRGRVYSVVVERGRDPATGKRRREWNSGHRTKRDAGAARIELLGRLQRAEHFAPTQLTPRFSHAALRDALRWGLLLRNVADAASPPSAQAAKAKPPKVWSAAQLQAFLRSRANDRLAALWTLYAMTGLRRGVAIRLQSAERQPPREFRSPRFAGAF